MSLEAPAEEAHAGSAASATNAVDLVGDAADPPAHPTPAAQPTSPPPLSTELEDDASSSSGTAPFPPPPPPFSFAHISLDALQDMEAQLGLHLCDDTDDGSASSSSTSTHNDDDPPLPPSDPPPPASRLLQTPPPTAPLRPSMAPHGGDTVMAEPENEPPPAMPASSEQQQEQPMSVYQYLDAVLDDPAPAYHLAPEDLDPPSDASSVVHADDDDDDDDDDEDDDEYNNDENDDFPNDPDEMIITTTTINDDIEAPNQAQHPPDVLPAEVVAADVARGLDMQGIDWSLLPVTRAEYRAARTRSYNPYRNTSCDVPDPPTWLPEAELPFFTFAYTKLALKCTLTHFQLRHLVSAPTKNDVVYTHETHVMHYDTHAREAKVLIDCFSDARATPHGPVRISSMCADARIVCAGGYHGEYVVRALDTRERVHAGVVTQDENGITNHCTLSWARLGGVPQLTLSSNDMAVRVLDLHALRVVRTWGMPWAVNATAYDAPDARLACIVGDGTDALVVDADRGTLLHTLRGHVDYGFAAAWSADGVYCATGNQDRTVRVYDVRAMHRTLRVWPARMGAPRSLQWTSRGELVVAEDADFVHIVSPQWDAQQTIDFFGEIAGVACSPDASALFIGNADATYGSILEFRRAWPPLSPLGELEE